MNSGPWVPIGLSDDYDNTDNDPPDSPPDLNPSSQLVRGINCLDFSTTNTNLGDSIHAAGSYLVNNGRPDVPDGVVFMTDGEANQPTSSGNPCTYAQTRAQQVKSAGVIVVTIAYRLQGVDCSGTPATTVLANMASDPESGVSTVDDGGDGSGGLPGGCDYVASAVGGRRELRRRPLLLCPGPKPPLLGIPQGLRRHPGPVRRANDPGQTAGLNTLADETQAGDRIPFLDELRHREVDSLS